MSSIGGSIFAHNAIQYGYCLKESIASLCHACDEVVVMDAESDDGTLELMYECKKEHSNLRVIAGAKWECAENYSRLAMLATQAKNFLNTQWHFMLQADEVLHEKSRMALRNAVKLAEQKGYESFHCRRINLFADVNHYLRFDLPQEKKPCSDVVNRFGLKKFDAVGDAESLGSDAATCCTDLIDKIQIWHYGFVRNKQVMCDKVISMQSWFFGKGSTPDHRVVECKNTSGEFEWQRFKEREDFDPIPWKHPKFSRAWAAERLKEQSVT